MTFLNYSQINGNQGKPVIYLIHSIPLDSTYLINSLKVSKPANLIIAIDLPSHGKSMDIKNDKLTFHHMAQEIEKLRIKLYHQEIIIYGHGVGGFVAQHYAIKFQKQLKGLILSNTAPNAKYREEMAWNIRDRFSKSTKHAIEGYYGQTDEKSIRARFSQSLAVHFKPTNYDLANKILDNCERIASQAYVHLSQNEIPKHDLREKLRKIKVNTLIIAGKTDVWPENSSLFIKNDINHATLKILETGHFSMIEKPQIYWNLISEWLN